MEHTEKQSLPNGWKWTTLGDSFKWGSGGTPLRSNPSFYNGDIPWVIIGDLADSIVFDTKTKITEEGLRNSSAKWVEPGSVLIAMYGSIGKLGIAGKRLTTNQAIAFTNSDHVLSKYLFYYLLSQRANLNNLGMGATQQNISQTIIKSYPFPYAPLLAQEQIVAKIDELFSQLDAAEAALKRARANLKRYRQSVLQAAVTGELTREWRESHQGEIDELHFDANKNSKDFEKIVNPYGWGVFKFEELISKSQNGLSKRNSELGNDVIVLRLADITSDMVNTEKKRYIKCSKQEIVNYELHKDDLLCIRVNGSRDLVGRVIRISELPETMLFCDHFIRFKLKNDSMAKYLSLYLNSDLIRKYIEKNMVSSAGQNTVSQGTYFNIMVTLPSIQEQYKILEYIEQAYSIISNLDKIIEINLTKIAHIRQSILSQAFTGNLIPQELEL